MKALDGLSTTVRWCPNCGGKKTVNYWAHGDDESVKRYQCDACSTQVPDFTRMAIRPRQYAHRMATVVGTSYDQYVFRFGQTICRHRDSDGNVAFSPLFRLLE